MHIATAPSDAYPQSYLLSEVDLIDQPYEQSEFLVRVRPAVGEAWMIFSGTEFELGTMLVFAARVMKDGLPPVDFLTQYATQDAQSAARYLLDGHTYPRVSSPVTNTITGNVTGTVTQSDDRGPVCF